MWANAFTRAETHGHRRPQLLVLVEEYVQVCLAIDPARPLTPNDVLERLIDVLIRRGVPDYIRPGSGTDLTRKVVRAWLAEVDVRTLFMERGRL